MAFREFWTVTSGHGQAEESSDQEDILHFAGLSELVRVFQRARMLYTRRLK